MKITKFCWGIELSDAVKCLAIFGMVLAVPGMFGGFILFYLMELQLSVFVINGTSFLLLLTHISWFFYSVLLYMKSSNNDIEAMKKMIKIGCYVIGTVQVATSAACLLCGVLILGSIVLFIQFLFNPPCELYFTIILIVVGGVCLIFTSQLVHGIRTKCPGKIKHWIIFMCVMLAIFLPVVLCGSFFVGTIMWTILLLVGGVIAFSYSSIMVIVHYNILLENQNVLDSVVQNFCYDKHNKIEMSTKAEELPPPYSQVF